jgi:DNA-binding NarL/FixJ family response regulator
MSAAPVTCIIADDHPLMREIIRLRLEAAGMQLVGEAANGTDAINLIEDRHPAVAIVDLRMPGKNGLEIVRALAEQGSETRVLLYSDDANPDVVRRALQSGARGYLNKASGQELLENALETIVVGGTFVDPAVAGRLLQPPAYALSPRELDVLALMAEGLQNKVIAQRLNVAEDTVKSHVSSLMNKLGATSRTGAVSIALREELVV